MSNKPTNTEQPEILEINRRFTDECVDYGCSFVKFARLYVEFLKAGGVIPLEKQIDRRPYCSHENVVIDPETKSAALSCPRFLYPAEFKAIVTQKGKEDKLDERTY